jgi:hypothetical protein
MSDSVHPTHAQLRGLAAGTLPPHDLLKTARHVAGCPACANAASEIYDVDPAVADLKADLLADDEVHTRSPWWIAIAAMLAGAALLAMIWTATHRSMPRHSTPVTIVHAERPEWKALVNGAMATQSIPPPDILRDLRPSPGSLRAAHATPATGALAPAGVVVESDRPRFSWAPVEGARTYQVIVFSHGSEVARSEPLDVTSWQPSVPLTRGGMYEWQVIASTPHGDVVLPPPEARRALIGILSAEAEREIAEAKRERPDDRLLLALLYARAGVADRAEEELRAYAAANPRSPAGAALLQSVARWPR